MSNQVEQKNSTTSSSNVYMVDTTQPIYILLNSIQIIISLFSKAASFDIIVNGINQKIIFYDKDSAMINYNRLLEAWKEYHANY